MSVRIEYAHGNPDELPDGALVADRRLYENAARTRIVEDGDSEAAFLLAGQGRVIGKADVERLGLECVNGRVVQASIEKAEPVGPALELEQPALTPPPVVGGESKGDDEKQPAGGDSSAAAT
jgi:hypothetical protein